MAGETVLLSHTGSIQQDLHPTKGGMVVPELVGSSC